MRKFSITNTIKFYAVVEQIILFIVVRVLLLHFSYFPGEYFPKNSNCEFSG